MDPIGGQEITQPQLKLIARSECRGFTEILLAGTNNVAMSHCDDTLVNAILAEPVIRTFDRIRGCFQEFLCR